MNALEMIGREVLDKNVNRIGKLSDIGIDVENGTVEYFVIKTGLTKKVHIRHSEIARAGEKIILNVSREELTKSTASGKK